MAKKGFTLVELIVVITILAILGTIAFISFSGYSRNARDSVRIDDLGNLMTAIELSNVHTGYYPATTEGVDITYSGAMVWRQGTFGEETFRLVDKVNKIPTDPLTGNEYAYSRTYSENEYEVGAVFEASPLAGNPLISQANAEGTQLATAYIKGDYNGVFIKVSTGAVTYVLAVPTIIGSDLSLLDLWWLIENQHLAYNGGSNLPAAYEASSLNINGGFNFDPSTIIIYTTTGSLTELSSTALQTEFLEGIQTAYAGTNLATSSDTISRILAIDTVTDSISTEFMAQTLIHNYLVSSVKVTSTGSLSSSSSSSTSSSTSSSSSSSSSGGASPVVDEMMTWLGNGSYMVSQGFNRNTIEYNGRQYFAAKSGSSSSSGGGEGFIKFVTDTYALDDGFNLYSIDDEGTTKDFGVDLDFMVNDSKYFQNFTLFNGNLYFIANPGTGSKLYYIDSSNNMTMVPSSPTISSYRKMAVFNDRLWFYAYDPTDGHELHYIDTSNTVGHIDINTSGNSEVDGMTVYNNRLWFVANSAASGNDLHYVNTSNSLGALDISPGTGLGLNGHSELTVFNSRLYMLGNVSGEGSKFIYVDSSNTINVVAAIPTGQYVSNGKIVFNSRLYIKTDSGNGSNLHYLDTSNNITEVSPNIEGGGRLQLFNSLLYFNYVDESEGWPYQYKIGYLNSSHNFGTVAGIKNRESFGYVMTGQDSYNDKIYFFISNGCSGYLETVNTSNVYAQDTSIAVENNCE